MRLGEYIKPRRLDLGFSLRKFCELIEYDASNWSKIERGVIPPPPYSTKEVAPYDKIRVVLRLSVDEYKELITIASVDRKEIPVYIEDNILNALPVFFQTIHKGKLGKKELEKLIEMLKTR